MIDGAAVIVDEACAWVEVDWEEAVVEEAERQSPSSQISGKAQLA